MWDMAELVLIWVPLPTAPNVQKGHQCPLLRLPVAEGQADTHTELLLIVRVN